LNLTSKKTTWLALKQNFLRTCIQQSWPSCGLRERYLVKIIFYLPEKQETFIYANKIYKDVLLF
jgi:hypothetical protein